VRSGFDGGVSGPGREPIPLERRFVFQKSRREGNLNAQPPAQSTGFWA
jgi:hypothetical protein